jgi:hemerythrin-like domain-containing protein
VLPVEVLISEHRLIEGMVQQVGKEVKAIMSTGKVNANFIVGTVDFFRTYADRYHHGKEEGILFKGLSDKKVSDADRKMILELVMEHAFARKTVKGLEALKESYIAGNAEALKGILDSLNALTELLPKHIQKEDELFFLPSMKYFTQAEQERMLDDFSQFDKGFTNKRYEQIIKTLSS